MPAAVAAPVAATEPAASSAPPVTIHVNVDAKQGTVKKSLSIGRDKDGNLTSAEITSAPDGKEGVA